MGSERARWVQGSGGSFGVGDATSLARGGGGDVEGGPMSKKHKPPNPTPQPNPY